MHEVIDRGFWHIEYPDNLVTGLWTGHLSCDFEQMSSDYYRAGHCILASVLRNGRSNNECDFVFPVAAYLLRHAIELAFKAVICAKKNNSQICDCFQRDKHDIRSLFDRSKNDLESCLDVFEIEWLNGFASSSNVWDSSSDFFRYPLSSKNSLNGEFIDVFEASKTLTAAYETVLRACELGDSGVSIYDAKSSYLSIACGGIGNCLLHAPLESSGLYFVSGGFSRAAELLCNDTVLSWREKCFPLLFLLRHSIELGLKHLTCPRNIIGARGKQGHALGKLWEVPRARLKLQASKSGWDLAPLDIVNDQLAELNRLDKGGFLFRYPVNKSMEYQIPPDSKIDVKSIYEYQKGIIDFLDGCNYVVDEIEDYDLETPEGATGDFKHLVAAFEPIGPVSPPLSYTTPPRTEN